MSLYQYAYRISLLITTVVLFWGCGSEAGPAEHVLSDTLSASTETKGDTGRTSDTNSSIANAPVNGNGFERATVDLVTTVLRREFATDLEKGFVDSLSRNFSFDTVDLNNTGKPEILVALNGPYFCGSGGCTTLLLDSAGKVITTFSVVQYPVLIDTNTTNGWRNLVMYSGSSYRKVQMRGKSYPANPSIQPTLKIADENQLRKVFDIPKKSYPVYTF